MASKRVLGELRRGGHPLPYGKGVVSGGLVLLSGIDGAVGDDGSPVAGIEDQTVVALRRLQQYLGDAGGDLDDLLKVTWYVTDRAHLPGFFAARGAWMQQECPSLVADLGYASTLVIAGLATPEMLVEIDAIARNSAPD